jgi:hypothetical protein
MGMPSLRTRRPSLSGSLVLLAIALAVWSSASADAPIGAELSGRVRDLLGQRIPDVEILVVSPSSGGNPIAAARSDAAGLFSVSGLAPGLYRVAALKGGYLTFLGQVNTRVDNWLDVIMRPAAVAASNAGATLPEDVTWALRLPRRSLLRETEAEVVPAGGFPAEDRQAGDSFSDSSLRVQVEQLFALRRGPRPDAGAAPGGQGAETRLSVASALGQRGSIRFRGAHESFDTTRSRGDSGSSASQGAVNASVDFVCDTGRDSRVAVEAFYNERDFRLASENPGIEGGAERRGRRSWGYDAAWSTQLDAASNLALEVDFLESRLDLAAELLELPAPSSSEPVSHRSVGAAGSYETLAAGGHQLEVDFRARLVRSPLPALRAPSGELRVDPQAVSGWSVGLEAQDTWRVSGPFALVYGLGYRHSLASRDVSLVVPRVGGSWSIDELALSFLVSYHRVDSWGGADRDVASLVFRPAGSLGYEAQLELPLGDRLRLRGATRSAPIQLESSAGTRGAEATEFQPAYLTDGNASVDEDRVALIREGAGVRAFLELISGRAEGNVAPVLPVTMPFQWLSESSLRYRNGRLGLRVAASGTDLLLDYREVAERLAGLETTGIDYEQQSLELRVAQDLMRLRSLGDWRFLLALRMGSQDGESSDEWSSTSDARLLSAPEREMSAGLSVLF